MYKTLRAIGKNLLERDNENEILKKLLNSIDKNVFVLDVGCGYGEKLILMKSLGFKNIVGVDVNQDSLDSLRSKKFEVFNPREFKEKNDKKFGLILFSHVVEHFEYRELIAFLENYFSYGESMSKVIIITPLLSDFFYDNLDHVKPYTPWSFHHLFTNDHHEVQYKSKYQLELVNLYFRKMPFSFFKFTRRGFYGKLNFLQLSINLLFSIIYLFSFNLISRTTGWAGLYILKK